MRGSAFLHDDDGSAHNLSARAADLGHRRESTEVLSTCSVHNATSPPVKIIIHYKDFVQLPEKCIRQISLEDFSLESPEIASLD